MSFRQTARVFAKPVIPWRTTHTNQPVPIIPNESDQLSQEDHFPSTPSESESVLWNIRHGELMA